MITRHVEGFHNIESAIINKSPRYLVATAKDEVVTNVILNIKSSEATYRMSQSVDSIRKYVESPHSRWIPFSKVYEIAMDLRKQDKAVDNAFKRIQGPSYTGIEDFNFVSKHPANFRQIKQKTIESTKSAEKIRQLRDEIAKPDNELFTDPIAKITHRIYMENNEEIDFLLQKRKLIYNARYELQDVITDQMQDPFDHQVKLTFLRRIVEFADTVKDTPCTVPPEYYQYIPKCKEFDDELANSQIEKLNESNDDFEY